MKREHTSPVEFTVLSVGLGIAIGVIMTAANVYLGLYAGMTVSASIPAAVIAMAFLRAFRRTNVLESNIVQTIASAGESLAAGVIFTVPALVLVGTWTDFKFWPTTLIAICGGLLGVVFMIPLRKALIIDSPELTYPEGVACAAVLRAGAGEAETADEGSADEEAKDRASGIGLILRGLVAGGALKFATTGLGVIHSTVEWAGTAAGRVFSVGFDISAALISVGYIVRLEIAVLVFIGGAIGWFIALPMLGIPADLAGQPAADIAGALWSQKVRYLGVGAMIVGGVWSIFTVRSGIASGLQGLRGHWGAESDATVPRTERNVSLMGLLIVFLAALGGMFFLYDHLIGHLGMSLLTTAIMVVVSFFIVAVASYITGLVGSSNSPVSGMTISALLGTAALFLVLGFRGDSAILATLGVAAVVCCAACTSGDCSQDLKTGYLVGATPKWQQYAQMIGVVVPAFVIAPVLSVLHHTYVIGSPQLNAPQATLFESITRGLFGNGTLPYDMVLIGMALGVVIILIDVYLKRRGDRFRFHIMPLAVGIYLPVSLGTTILIGGIIHELAHRGKACSADGGTDKGILLSSGLIAGEAVMGVLLAVALYVQADLNGLAALMVLGGIAWYLYSATRGNGRKSEAVK